MASGKNHDRSILFLSLEVLVAGIGMRTPLLGAIATAGFFIGGWWLSPRVVPMGKSYYPPVINENAYSQTSVPLRKFSQRKGLLETFQIPNFDKFPPSFLTTGEQSATV